MTSPTTRRAMQGNRSRDTQPELAIRSIIHGRGLRYRVAARPLARQRFTADIVFKGMRVAVFVDGCFWHGCPDHYRRPGSNTDYWDAKVSRNRDRDRAVDRMLTDAGWAVLRAWEHEPPRSVADRIEAMVRG